MVPLCDTAFLSNLKAIILTVNGWILLFFFLNFIFIYESHKIPDNVQWLTACFWNILVKKHTCYIQISININSSTVYEIPITEFTDFSLTLQILLRIYAFFQKEKGKGHFRLLPVALASVGLYVLTLLVKPLASLSVNFSVTCSFLSQNFYCHPQLLTFFCLMTP